MALISLARVFSAGLQSTFKPDEATIVASPKGLLRRKFWQRSAVVNIFVYLPKSQAYPLPRKKKFTQTSCTHNQRFTIKRFINEPLFSLTLMPKKTQKKKKAAKKARKSPAKKQKTLSNNTIAGIAVLVFLAVIAALFLFNLDKIFPEENKSSEDTIVLEVNDEPVRAKELERKRQIFDAQFGPQITREFVINQTVSELLLLQAAEEEGITVNQQKIDEGVDRWLAQVQQQMDPDQLQMVLDARNMTIEDLRNETKRSYRNNFLIFGYLNKTVFSGIDDSGYLETDITDEDVREHYEANKEQYVTVNASHILICHSGARNCDSNRTEEEAMALIEDIQSQLIDGKDFDELAREYSDCPSASMGGLLGEFGRGQMTPDFEEAAFSLKHPNQLSDIIETDFGFHIIRLNEIKDSFEDFEDEIRLALQFQEQQQRNAELQAVQQQAIKEHLDMLWEEADIKYYTHNPALSGNIKPKPGILTFSQKNNPICKDDGKPVIRMYSTTSCPHCTWVSEAFDSVAKKYVSDGKVVAYHWQLDSEDNTLTSFKEDYMPEDEKQVYYKFNPQGTVPTFVFGCKYYRIGTGYEAEDDLRAEKEEF